jgi:hypothetical protein
MKFSALFGLLALGTSTVVAFPTSRLGSFQAASSGDSRSPCPLLNSLANHNMINHNGRDITQDALYSALRGVGCDDTIASKLAQGALKAVGKNGVVDLHDLSQHGIIEHDASLSRQDAAIGDNAKADPDLIKQLLSSSSDGQVITISDLGKYRALRQSQSKTDNPQFEFGIKQQLLAGGEAAALLTVIGSSDSVSVDDVNTFFSEERFPDDWTPHNPDVTLPQLLGVVAKLGVDVAGAQVIALLHGLGFSHL